MQLKTGLQYKNWQFQLKILTLKRGKEGLLLLIKLRQYPRFCILHGRQAMAISLTLFIYYWHDSLE